jgi:hypothetical protein
VVPVNRLFRPGFSAKRWRGLATLAREIPRLWRFDEGRYNTDVLPVNIEKFYDTCAFDLTASANCHQVYLTPHGFIPFCLYNSFFRGGEAPGC